MLSKQMALLATLALGIPHVQAGYNAGVMGNVAAYWGKKSHRGTPVGCSLNGPFRSKLLWSKELTGSTFGLLRQYVPAPFPAHSN